MTTHLDPEDEATLEVHGWRRLKHFDNETKRWELTDAWLLLDKGHPDKTTGMRTRVLKKGELFRLHVNVSPQFKPAAASWVGPSFDTPADISRYLWMLGDGDMWTGVSRAIEAEWGG